MRRPSCASWSRSGCTGRRPGSAGRVLALALLALLVPVSLAAQEPRTLRGEVVHEGTGQPIEGAYVGVVGLPLQTLTNEAGQFLLFGVPDQEVTLTVTRIGYREHTVRVSPGSTTIRIELVMAAIALDEVIVTGTAGATQRRAIGNSVTRVDAVGAMELSASGNVSGLMNGRTPGVIITSGTGRVGAGPSINIRGRSTISLSQEPLIYIDGVRVNNDIATGPSTAYIHAVSRLNDINPEDIESLEIIKGPAAATLYGTEAANGVIQIITKRGIADAGPRFTGVVRHGTSWFQDAERRLATNYALHPVTGELLSFNAVRYERERGRELWDTGRLQGYSLGVQGGAGMVRYYISTAYDREDGVEPGNGLRRFTGNTTLSIIATDDLDIEASANIVKARTDLGGGSQSSLLFSAHLGNPLFEALDFPTGPYLSHTPEVYRNVFEAWQDLARFTGSVQVNHRPTSWLQHRLIFGLDQTTEDNQYLRKHAPEHLQKEFASEAAARGGLTQQLRNIAYATVDYNVSVTQAVNEGLTSTASAGFQYYRRRTDSNSITADEFPAPGLRTAAAAARVTGSQDYVTNSTLGMFVQQQFDWNNRIFLTGAIRVDNNSAFGEDIDFVTYPKFSATWVVSEEAFWNTDVMDQLRLRLAYGASGQQPIAFAALRTFAPATGRGDLPIVIPQSLGNPDLKPERGEELEVGFDAGFWGRVGLEFTYYNKRVRDAILQRSIAPSSGFSGSQFVNIGEISNRGLEVQLNVQAISRPTVGWDVSFSYATAKDEIRDLGGIPFIPLLLPMQRHVEGHAIGGFWTREIVSARLDDTGQAVDILCNDGNGGATDCATAPPIYHGTPTPTYNGGISTTVTLWNRLRLHGMVDFKGGHRLFNSNTFLRCTVLKICELNVKPEMADPIVLAATQISGDFSAVSPFLEKGNYAKLREVSASYTLPGDWARRFGAQRATLTVAGRNLHTWTGYTGLDPEGRADLSNAIISNDQAVLPVLPQFITTLRFTF